VPIFVTVVSSVITQVVATNLLKNNYYFCLILKSNYVKSKNKAS